jgi:2-polyprenyl-3-methyl-5-hydroxy-6-metoxy-1,4-benzoquinol methylase
LDCQRYGLKVFRVIGGINGMKILEEDIKLHDINAYSLRGKHFYKSIVDFRAKILDSQKHRILEPEQFRCVLCKNKTGRTVLEWELGYQLLQCNHCGAVSANIEQENEKQHINSVYNNDEYYEKMVREIHQQYEYRKQQFGNDRYDYIVGRLGLDVPKIKVLDIGCGAGYFLSSLQDNNVRCKGIEVTPHLVKYCQNRGFDVDSNQLAEEPDEEYDVITMFDVLEHLSDPILMLNTIKKKLRVGGYCIAFTPNINSIGYELMQSNQNTLLPFEHLCFFSKNSLEYLSKEVNLTLSSVETFGLDIMDYLLMKEYEDNIPYTKKLHDMMVLVQGCIDKMGVSNHFRITFKKESRSKV